METRPGVESILPSLGKPYSGLIPDGLLQVYAMRTVEEKLFGSLSKRSDLERVIDALISRCTNIPKELKPEDLYIGDRTYLWIMIRAASYGSNYEFKVRCPECNAQWDHVMDITQDLEVRQLDDTWEDPFELELPYSKDTVTLRLLRGSHERKIVDFIERQNKKVNHTQLGDPSFVYRYALHVVQVKSVDPKLSFGSPDAEPKDMIGPSIEWVEKLYAPDSSAIREALDDRTPGIILASEFDCPKCSNNFNYPLPLTPEFFRTKPSTRSHTTARAISNPSW